MYPWTTGTRVGKPQLIKVVLSSSFQFCLLKVVCAALGSTTGTSSVGGLYSGAAFPAIPPSPEPETP